MSVVFTMSSLVAATLDVDLAISHGIYTGGELVTSRKVVFLVLDRSGSMAEPTLENKRTPDEKLVQSLKMQLDAIPLGTEVHVIPFSSTIWPELFYDKLDEGGRKAIIDFVQDKTPKGQTVLYDAQDMALTAAAQIMKSDATAEVRVLVYTDGVHLTPWNYEGEYKACYQTRVAGVLARKRFEENPGYEADRQAARKKFEEKFYDLVAKPNLEVEYEWLSADPKPEEKMHTKAIIPVELTRNTLELLNPLEYPKQAFKGTLLVPISDRLWEEVKGKSFNVEWTVGGKSKIGTMQLNAGHQTLSIEWPSLPEDNPEPATLTVRGLPEGRKFILKDSKSISYNIPALKRAEVDVAAPTEGAVVVLGEKVKFLATSSEKSATWKFPSSEVKGLDFEKTFEEEGKVKFTVTAGGGVRATKVEREIEVIRTGVEIKGVANGYYEIGKPATLTAAAMGPVSGYVWTVDGVEVADAGEALTRTFDKVGNHEIGVTARYKQGIVATAKSTIYVWATPAIGIVEPEEYDGESESSTRRVGTPVELKASVTGAFSTAVWVVTMGDKEIARIPVAVKDGLAVGSYVPEKVGLHDVSVTAEGLAGSISVGEEIRQFHANPKR